MPTVSALVAHTLSAHIDHVFGVMGNGNALLPRRPRSHADVRTPRCATRPAASSQPTRTSAPRADSPRRPPPTAPASRTRSPPLAEAAQARVPLVLVVGDEPTTGPRPWDVDQIAMASAVGARTFTVGRTDVAATTVLAIEHALANRTVSVLAIPYDVAGLEVGEGDDGGRPDSGATPARRRSRRRASSPPGCSPTSPRRSPAPSRPLLLAGRGAWLSGAGDALGALADATGAAHR